MQPYFFPYIGYFQLINCVDKFVVYDNIEYTKKGWINRNRILQNSKDSYISIPLKKDSDFIHICDRKITDSWPKERMKILNRIHNSYRKAPHFSEVEPLIENILNYQTHNLFDFILNSLAQTLHYLQISKELVKSSSIPIDHNKLKAEKKVIAICQHLEGTTYVNPIGGINLYNKNEFLSKDLDLRFLKSDEIKYKQSSPNFISDLSIIDVMMFNSVTEIKTLLENCHTIRN